MHFTCLSPDFFDYWKMSQAPGPFTPQTTHPTKTYIEKLIALMNTHSGLVISCLKTRFHLTMFVTCEITIGVRIPGLFLPMEDNTSLGSVLQCTIYVNKLNVRFSLLFKFLIKNW